MHKQGKGLHCPRFEHDIRPVRLDTPLESLKLAVENVFQPLTFETRIRQPAVCPLQCFQAPEEALSCGLNRGRAGEAKRCDGIDDREEVPAAMRQLIHKHELPPLVSLAVAHVPVYGRDAFHFAFCVAYRRSADLDFDERPVLLSSHGVPDEGPPARARSCQQCLAFRAVGRRHYEFERRTSDRLCGAEAEHLFGAWIPAHKLTIERNGYDCVCRRGYDGGEMAGRSLLLLKLR